MEIMSCIRSRNPQEGQTRCACISKQHCSRLEGGSFPQIQGYLVQRVSLTRLQHSHLSSGWNRTRASLPQAQKGRRTRRRGPVCSVSCNDPGPRHKAVVLELGEHPNKYLALAHMLWQGSRSHLRWKSSSHLW